jgi:hypothetical protein
MLWNIQGYIRDGNWLLTLIGGTILCAGFVLISLTYKAYRRERQNASTDHQQELVKPGP